MVGKGYGIVNAYGEGLEVFGAKDIVDAHVDGIAVKRASYAIGR